MPSSSSPTRHRDEARRRARRRDRGRARRQLARQFANEANPEIHRGRRPRRSGRTPTAKSTSSSPQHRHGGTITGVGQVLKARKPDVQIIAVEPEESPILNGGQPGPHKIQGIGANFVPEILDTEIYDEVIDVNGHLCRVRLRAATEEGLLVGISSGAAIAAASRSRPARRTRARRSS